MPADLKSRDIPLLLDLKMFYVAVGYDPTKGGLMFLEVTALDEKLRKLTQTEIDIDPDYGVGVYTLEQALQIPSCSFVDITVVASSNQTSCFRYFYADFAADNTVDDTVAMGITLILFGFLAVLQAIVVPACLTCVQKPSRENRGCCRCCDVKGLDGPGMLEHQKSRWVVTLMFAATIQWFFVLAEQMYFEGTDLVPELTGAGKHLAQLFIYILIFLVIAVLYLPLFLCYENRHRLVGLVFGFSSTSVLFGFRLIVALTISGQILMYIPDLVILVGILGFFSFRLFLFLTRAAKLTPLELQAENFEKDLRYVRQMLAPRKLRTRRAQDWDLVSDTTSLAGHSVRCHASLCFFNLCLTSFLFFSFLFFSFLFFSFLFFS